MTGSKEEEEEFQVFQVSDLSLQIQKRLTSTHVKKMNKYKKNIDHLTTMDKPNNQKGDYKYHQLHQQKVIEIGKAMQRLEERERFCTGTFC